MNASSDQTQRKAKPSLFAFFREILGPERDFYVLAVLYGLGISLLTLATPISVQMLINTVANVGLATPLVVLSLGLLALLLFASALSAMRIHVMDIFGRRFYARMVSEIALRTLYASNPYFEDNRQGPLFNRYFDIMLIIKLVPNLLVGGFTILLQAVVGFILVSSYHPFLFVFNIVVIFCMWLVWAIWGRRAMDSSIELSYRKHETAAWLESLAKSNGFYKSEQHLDTAVERTDYMTGRYIEQHKRHFAQYFSQILAFLAIYAAGSAALLGLGGWLVIQGQLSLGQLVAAELVLSAVFLGVSQLGVFLGYFYDVCAAVDKLSGFYKVAQEKPSGSGGRLEGDSTLTFKRVIAEAVGEKLRLDCVLPAASRVAIYCNSHRAQHTLIELFKGQLQPQAGYLAVATNDLRSMKAWQIRQEIIVLDRPVAVEATLREYLQLSGSSEGGEQIDVFTALRAVGLEETVTQLSEGLDTPLASTGWPLSIAETMQLKLAAAMIAAPRVLVLSQVFDAIPEQYLLQSLDLIRDRLGATVLLFTNKHTDFGCSHYLYMDHDRQTLFESYAAMCEACGLDARALREPLEGGGMQLLEEAGGPVQQPAGEQR